MVAATICSIYLFYTVSIPKPPTQPSKLLSEMAPKWTMHSKSAEHQTTIPFEAIPMKYYQLVRWLGCLFTSFPVLGSFTMHFQLLAVMQHQVIITIIIIVR